jgi:hypothetical protein
MGLDETTEVVKGANLITYFQFVLENDVKEDFLFFTPTDGRAISLEVFDIIGHFLQMNEIN